MASQAELNTELLTGRYDVRRWWKAFGANPANMLDESLGALVGEHYGMELRQSHIFATGIYFYSQLLRSPLRVRPACLGVVCWEGAFSAVVPGRHVLCGLHAGFAAFVRQRTPVSNDEQVCCANENPH